MVVYMYVLQCPCVDVVTLCFLVNSLTPIPIPSQARAKLAKLTTSRVPLLNANDDLSPALESALTAIFTRFDVDKDKAWSQAEIQAFAVATNGKPFHAQSVSKQCAI